MDDAMRDAAADLTDLVCLAVNATSTQIRDEIYSDALRIIASEADRREQECIEAACYDCELETHVERGVDREGRPYWQHERPGADEPSYCYAAALQERKYQRQQREKGEGNGS